MITREEIMKELAAGRSIEEIADAISNTINEANVAYQKKVDEEAEAAAKADAVKLAKREAMRDIISALANYADVSGLDIEGFMDELTNDEKLDEFCREIDVMLEFAKSMAKLADLQFAPVEKEVAAAPSKVTMSGPSSDEILGAFLKGIGL